MHPDDGRVVSNFIVQALRGEAITIYGDGSQTRSFCFVSDLVAALMKLMDSPDELTGPVNLGNPHEFTMLQLADAVLRLTGSRSKIERRPLPADDPKQRQPDIRLAGEKLGWTPTVSLDEGLVPTIRYFEELLRAEHK
jgi:UDP-glucuronate decarboxylase